MFKEEVPGRKCATKDGIEPIDDLKTKLLISNDVLDTNGLVNCIMEMFGDTDELQNNELDIYNNYTNMPSIDSQYNNAANTHEVRRTRDSVNNIALGNVFKQEREKMIEIKQLR